MHLITFDKKGSIAIAAKNEKEYVDLSAISQIIPTDMKEIISNEKLLSDIKNLIKNPDKNAYLDEDKIKFFCPIINPSKVICLGLNYINHLHETKYDTPKYPVLFARFPSSYVAHSTPIIKPASSDKYDYEGELAIIIGKKARRVKPEDAFSIIAGYSIFNDITLRDYQSRSHQWLAGKNFDNCGSFGPCIVTKDSFKDEGRRLHLTTKINGKKLQDDYTDNMLFDIPSIISYITEFTTLNPGDIIVTGTPSGVGFLQNPRLYLNDGDVCEITIEGIGTLKNVIKQEK